MLGAHRSVVTRLARILLAITLCLIAAGCADDPSAAFFGAPPQARPTPAIDASANSDTSAGILASRLIHGGISRPDPRLTPGVIALTDLTAVCRSGKRIRGLFTPNGPLVSASDRSAVFSEYKISAANTRHYGLDFLIPLQLGGANTLKNIWPASTSHGVGFREKQVLNIRMHELVCRRDVPLDVAQKLIATDWVKLWLLYG